ncbi:hypothetical protein MHYP_G00117500 [Metynnis hypsauchen]
MTKIAGFSKKNKSKIVYPDCDSALKPVPHDSENVVPLPPASPESDVYDEEEHSVDDNDNDEGAENVFEFDLTDDKPHLLQQAGLNDLVRELQLSKQKSELLTSQLQEWNLLERGEVSDEHGERFHQDISEMETRNQGHYNTNMMGDYCWFLQRETSVKHKRKSKCFSHF